MPENDLDPMTRFPLGLLVPEKSIDGKTIRVMNERGEDEMKAPVFYCAIDKPVLLCPDGHNFPMPHIYRIDAGEYIEDFCGTNFRLFAAEIYRWRKNIADDARDSSGLRYALVQDINPLWRLTDDATLKRKKDALARFFARMNVMPWYGNIIEENYRPLNEEESFRLNSCLMLPALQAISKK